MHSRSEHIIHVTTHRPSGKIERALLIIPAVLFQFHVCHWFYLPASMASGKRKYEAKLTHPSHTLKHN